MIDFSLVFDDVCNWLHYCKLSQNSPFGRGNKDIVLYCNFSKRETCVLFIFIYKTKSGDLL